MARQHEEIQRGVPPARLPSVRVVPLLALHVVLVPYSDKVWCALRICVVCFKRMESLALEAAPRQPLLSLVLHSQ